MRTGPDDPEGDGWQEPLDRMVLVVLAEAGSRPRARPAAAQAAAPPADPVEAFIGEAAAFLRGRPDARALLGRLAAMLPGAPGVDVGTGAAPGGPGPEGA